jgi:nucleotide-binding universal stress UspA family protein
MVESWVGSSSDFARYDDSRRKLADSILSAVKVTAEKLGVDAITVYVPDALPAVAIVSAAQERGCDLIVMASHGRRGIKRALLGSQTSEVLALTKIPVLVVK